MEDRCGIEEGCGGGEFVSLHSAHFAQFCPILIWETYCFEFVILFVFTCLFVYFWKENLKCTSLLYRILILVSISQQ